MLSLIILGLNIRVLFCVYKSSSNDDPITTVALLIISILITIFLAATYAKLNNHNFRLNTITVVFIALKIFLIIYFIISYFIGIHPDVMLIVKFLSFTYIIPLFLANELLTFVMNHPITGWVHYTGGNQGNSGGRGNGGGGPGQRPDPTTLANTPNPFYTYNNATGTFKINDPTGVVDSTNGRFNPNHTYNRAPFFKNAERFLANNRDQSATLIPRNLDAVQLRFLQDMREHHYHTIDHPNSTRAYSPYTGGSVENSRSFRENLASRGG